MRIDFNLRASPEGALATAYTGTPNSLAARSRIGRTPARAGTQMVPVPKPAAPAFCSSLTQYTSALVLRSRFVSLKELLMRWLTRYPAGLAEPVTDAGGGGSRPSIFV